MYFSIASSTSANSSTQLCSICRKIVDSSVCQDHQDNGNVLDQLGILLGYEVGYPLCNKTCLQDVRNLLNLMKELEKIQKLLKRGLAALGKKKVAYVATSELDLDQSHGEISTVAPLLAVAVHTPPPSQAAILSPVFTPTPPSPQYTLQLVTPSSLDDVHYTPSTSWCPAISQPPLPIPEQEQEPLPYIDVQVPHHQEEELVSNNNEDAIEGIQEEIVDCQEECNRSDPDYDNYESDRDNDEFDVPPSPKSCKTSSVKKSSKSLELSTTPKPPAPVNGDSSEKVVKKRKPPQENLGVIIETDDGRKFYEGYEVLEGERAYTCVTCGWSKSNRPESAAATRAVQGWTKRRDIKIHIKAEHLNGYRCDTCNKVFKCLKSQQDHFTKTAACLLKNPLRFCPTCEKSVKVRDYDSHVWVHKTDEEKMQLVASRRKESIQKVFYYCYKCGRHDFKHRNTLRAHLTKACNGTGLPLPIVVTNAITLAHRCEFCSKGFKFKDNLKAHIRRHCPKNIRPLIPCSICGKPVKAFTLGCHVRTHYSKAELEEAVKSKQNIPSGYNLFKAGGNGKTNEPTQKSRKLPCTVCGAPITPSYLPCHLWTHKSAAEKEVAHRLGQAPKFSDTSYLKSKLECPICGKKVWKWYLDQHMNIHKNSEERPTFTCPVEGCEATFTQKSGLNYHNKLIHETNKVRWHHCAFSGCNRKFSSASKLGIHTLRFHQIEKRRLHCTICNARFVHNKELRIHLARHRPAESYTILCPHCPVKFDSDSLLKSHKVRFHGEDKYKRLPRKEKKTLPKKRRRVQLQPPSDDDSFSVSSMDIKMEPVYDIDDLPVAPRRQPTRRAATQKLSDMQTNSRAVIQLHRLPSELVFGTEVRAINDNLVGFTSSEGIYQLVVLKTDRR